MAAIGFGRRALKYIAPLTSTCTKTGTRRYVTLPPTHTPWLRVPTNMGNPEFVEFDNFYNIVDKRLVKLETHDAYRVGSYRILCVGSSRGSLAFISENGRVYIGYPHAGSGNKCQYGIFNHDPHSSTRFYTKLSDDVDTFLCYSTSHHSINPTANNYHDFYVHWCRGWIRYPNLFHKDDPPIVYCQKTKTICKLSCYGNEHGPWVVELWNTSKERINVTCRINVLLAHDSSYEIETFEKELRAQCHRDRYLVLTGDEGGRGDPVLYLVVRYHNRELGVSQTRAVDVFRFDLMAAEMKATRKLDDHAFFIGQGSESFAIPVEQCGPGGLKPDSVYIADDLRVFDLKDGSITPILDTGDLSMTRFQSLWIPPPTQEQIEQGKKWREYMS